MSLWRAAAASRRLLRRSPSPSLSPSPSPSAAASSYALLLHAHPFSPPPPRPAPAEVAEVTPAEARRLVRLVGVEVLKRRLLDGRDEVVGYSDLLDDCIEAGAARTHAEAAALARAMDDAGIVLLFRDKAYLHPEKVVDLVRRAVPLALGPENDPRKEEFKQLQEKEEIDKLAHKQVRRILWSGLGFFMCQCATRAFSTSKNVTRGRVHQQKELEPKTPAKDTDIIIDLIRKSTRELEQGPIGKNLSSAEKRKFLINTLLGLEDSREVIYSTLDAWVAFEQDFPLASLKQAISALEKEEQWHRIVQVIKWMLSKGQGNTMRTYEQLVCALEKDNRAEEAHKIWQKKVAHDLQSVPWRFCHLMLAIYYRNNRLESLMKLFKELEACGRKPPSKDIIRKVEDAYEILGLIEEKKALLEKYKDLYNKPSRDDRKKGSKSKKTEMNKKGDGSMQSKMETSENLQDHCCPSDKESAVTI